MAPFDIDESYPADDQVLSQFPAGHRAEQQAISDIVTAEHDEGSGHHKFPGGTDAQRNAITDWVVGSLWLKTDVTPAKIQRVVSLGPVVWQDLGGEFPSGTRMVFDQDAAPTGWTRQNITGERLIKLAGSGDTGQTEAGTWTIGGVTVDSHTLSTAEIPAHSHGISYRTDDSFTNPSGCTAGVRGTGNNNCTNTNAIQNAGGGGGHTHGLTADGAWRPANRILIVAEKD